LKNGKAVEFLSLAVLVSSLESHQVSVVIPEIGENLHDHLYLRNELPLTFGSRPGHSGELPGYDIATRFVSAFTPKVEFNWQRRTFSVFREGVPARDLLSYVNNGVINRLRADLVVVPGSFAISREDHALRIVWVDTNFRMECLLRIVDAPTPSIVFLESQGVIPSSRLLVECSVSKSPSNLKSQLARYVEPFGLDCDTKTVFSYLRSAPVKVLDYNLDLSRILDQLGQASSDELTRFRSWLYDVLTTN
jgi:hypothetical protein